jgi:L-glyceraldehyde 3-phosphate reductase
MYVPAENRYSQMKYNRCGRSGLLLPAISLGLWHNFGGVDVFENGRKIIRAAFDKGITHFDLANNYGPPPGSAEENFGRMLRKDFPGHLRDELIISSKAGYLMWPGPYGEWGSRKYVMSSCDQSLRRLGLDYVDIFYSHRPDPETPFEETMLALDSIVRQGKALYVGLSNYDAAQTKAAVAILNGLGTPCLIHQPKYSMFVRWVEQPHAEIKQSLLDVLDEQGIGCIPFSPLAQGMLSDRYLSGIPEGSRAAKSWGFLQAKEITPAKLAAIRGLNDIASSRGQTLAQMALAWLFRHGHVTSVLIGVSSVSQLDDNIGALSNLDFSDSELGKIEKILASVEN